MGEADLHDLSPIRLPHDSAEDTALLLSELYEPHERLYIGPAKFIGNGSEHVKTASQWCNLVTAGHLKPETLVPNPLTGLPDPGTGSFRTNQTVAVLRFAVVEFDGGDMVINGLPADAQYEFFAGVDLPIAALIYSGGKSIHAWVRVDCTGPADWDTVVKHTLYRLLEPMGADPANKAASTLSRLPGVTRADTGRAQRLLYLCPEGRSIQ